MAISESDSSSAESLVSPPPIIEVSSVSTDTDKQGVTASQHQRQSIHDNDTPSDEPREESGRVKKAVDQVEKQQRQSAMHLSFRGGLQRSRDPKMMFAAARNAVRASLSPRSKSAKPVSAKSTELATDASTSPTGPAAVAPIRTAFGKFRRSSHLGESRTSVRRLMIDTQSVDTGVEAHNQDQQQQTFSSSTQSQAGKQLEATPLPNTASQLPASLKIDTSDLRPSDNGTVGRGFVDEVRHTLDELVALLDGVDPKKLVAIRLGGELRGLLGKAQDEFCAYESSFADYAGHVGVSIALQNFAASLHQVFGLATRLQAAKFLLNKTFKREVTFAFQEINSYYTSLFMELSMAVARRSGIELPLPSPVKPQLPPPTLESDVTNTPVLVKTAEAMTQTNELPPPGSPPSTA